MGPSSKVVLRIVLPNKSIVLYDGKLNECPCSYWRWGCIASDLRHASCRAWAFLSSISIHLKRVVEENFTSNPLKTSRRKRALNVIHLRSSVGTNPPPPNRSICLGDLKRMNRPSATICDCVMSSSYRSDCVPIAWNQVWIHRIIE